MKKSELGTLIIGSQIENKKNNEVFTINNITEIDSKVKYQLSNDKTITASSMLRWYNLVQPETVEQVELPIAPVETVEQVEPETEQPTIEVETVEPDTVEKEKIEQLVKDCVKAVEQIYKDIHGDDKKAQCENHIVQLLYEYGITITQTELDIMIESAVQELNKTLKEDKTIGFKK
jgi:hypothetical protein